MEQYLKQIEKYNTIFENIIKYMPELSTSELEFLMRKKLKQAKI